MIIFCLPYAGGSKQIFLNWSRYFDNDIEICPLELAGRGSRRMEKPYKDLNHAVDDIYSMVKEDIEKTDYTIYGHSMGGVLAYELYHKIESSGKRIPKHIFFSGVGIPGSSKENTKLHLLPDDKFMEKIISLGGTPKEILNHSELLRIYTPILKNDFRLLAEYEYIPKSKKIQCDVSVFNGVNDTRCIINQEDWAEFVQKNAKFTFLREITFLLEIELKRLQI